MQHNSCRYNRSGQSTPSGLIDTDGTKPPAKKHTFCVVGNHVAKLRPVDVCLLLTDQAKELGAQDSIGGQFTSHDGGDH